MLRAVFKKRNLQAKSAVHLDRASSAKCPHVFANQRAFAKKLLREETGASAVIVCLCLAMLIGCLAVVVDLGASYANKVKLQTAVDNAAMSGGAMLPITSTSSERAEVEAQVKQSMAENGFDEDEVELELVWSSNGSYDYQLRVNAQTTIVYGFAKIFGQDEGKVSATAAVNAKPISSTFKAISVYIPQSSFESQVSSINTNTPFTITITSSGSVSTSSANMGIMRIVTDSDRSNYQSFEGITTARDKEFFQTGYYGMDSNGNKVGLSVGESRVIENNSSIYSNAYTGILARMTACNNECGAGCSHSNHSNSCPRIALLPVVSTSSSGGGSWGGRGSYGSSSSGNATVQYFVAIYIDSISKTSSGTTITAYYLDDYREVSDVDDSAAYTINEYTVCTPVLTE